MVNQQNKQYRDKRRMRTIYKIKNTENINLFDPIKTIFANRNVSPEDIEWYINPTKFEYDSSLLKNIDKGVSLLLSHIEKGNHIHIQIDKDCDGINSAAILYNYLTKTFKGINLTWSNHLADKKHGINPELVEPTVSLLLVPDAGSNDLTEQKILHDRGVDVLIIDHHESDKVTEHSVIINNQLDDYPNKWLSGAGMCLKFVEHIDKTIGKNNAKDFRDLSSWGMIGDAMKLSSKETKWLMTDGINNVKNEFLKEMIKENVDKDVELSPSIFSFKINPKLNSYLRMASVEELDDLFKAFIGHQEVTINPRLRKADKSETWARRLTRICNNMYAKQRKLKETLLEDLSAKIEREKLYENSFIVVEIEGEFEMNMSGYISSFLVNKYRKPTLVLRKDEKDGKFLVGSMRGYDSFLADTKGFLQGLNLFDVAEGHSQAAGLRISYDKFKKLDTMINEALTELDSEEVHIVDMVLPSTMLTKTFVSQIEKFSGVWGKGLENPMWAIENLEVNMNDAFIMGKNEDMIKMIFNGIEVIKFSGVDTLKDLKADGKTVVLNVVGKTGMNSWKGNLTPQFIIEDFEIVEVKEAVRFVF